MKVHLLMSEINRVQNARYNGKDKKNTYIFMSSKIQYLVKIMLFFPILYL
jgi:hypothetical protein